MPETLEGLIERVSYVSFLDAIRDVNHAEHEEMLEWVGGKFDPEAFDMTRVNRQLQRLG